MIKTNKNCAYIATMPNKEQVRTPYVCSTISTTGCKLSTHRGIWRRWNVLTAYIRIVKQHIVLQFEYSSVTNKTAYFLFFNSGFDSESYWIWL